MPDAVVGLFWSRSEAELGLRKLKEGAACAYRQKPTVFRARGPLLNWGSLASNGRALHQPLALDQRRLVSQATSVPAATPIKAPTAVSLGKWCPRCTRDAATPVASANPRGAAFG